MDARLKLIGRIAAGYAAGGIGPKLTKEGRGVIRGGIGQIVQEVERNIPWFVTCYQEATERVSAAAKAEADAWLTTAIHRAGLGALRARLLGEATGEEPLTLPAGEDRS